MFEDNFIISDSEKLDALQDKFFVHINTALETEKDFYQFEFAASKKTARPLMNEAASKVKNLEAAILVEGNNQALELKIPLKSIQAVNSNAIRLNIGIMDHDRPENTKPSVMWWHPIWNSNGDYVGSSTFYKE